MQGNLNQQGLGQQGLGQQGLVQQGLGQQGLGQQGLGQQGLGQHGVGHQGLIQQGQQLIGGSHTTHQGISSVPQTMLSEIHGTQHSHGTDLNQHGLTHGVHQQGLNQGIPQQGFNQGIPQQGFPQQSGGQPLQFSGVQPTVIPVGGVGSGPEQYAAEALMRGVDPLNTQQHYQYNVVNGSTNPGYSGIPMNYSAANTGHSISQTPQNLTQTPLYSGSQPLQYEGNAGHAEVLTNTHTTGHHNEGYQSKIQQIESKIDQKWGTHGHTVDQKNLNTGDFRNNHSAQ